MIESSFPHKREHSVAWTRVWFIFWAFDTMLLVFNFWRTIIPEKSCQRLIVFILYLFWVNKWLNSLGQTPNTIYKILHMSNFDSGGKSVSMCIVTSLKFCLKSSPYKNDIFFLDPVLKTLYYFTQVSVWENMFLLGISKKYLVVRNFSELLCLLCRNVSIGKAAVILTKHCRILHSQ